MEPFQLGFFPVILGAITFYFFLIEAFIVESNSAQRVPRYPAGPVGEG